MYVSGYEELEKLMIYDILVWSAWFILPNIIKIIIIEKIINENEITIEIENNNW